MNRLIAAHAPAAVVGKTVFISVELWELELAL
jgi:hypothetical protein